MKLDTVTQQLALEIRDGDLLLASFFVLSCENLELQELRLPQANAWWQGLEDAHAGLVLLHGYGDRKLGQHKGITALAANGQVQWQKPDLAFYGIGEQGIFAHEVAKPGTDFRLLQLPAGEEAHPQVAQAKAASEVAAFNLTRFKDCLYPVLYLEGEAYFEQVAAFLSDAAAVHPVKAIEYAETELNIFLSFYQSTQTAALDNFLFIFDLEGNLTHSECLATELTGIGSDTFFIFRGDLYFIQQKEILQIFSLHR
ncbi:DUF4905 domain-containing protein [Pontibacter sp. 13R65]|uniref:DUF4905 domain-containing protein n=1 Tax=Pontibacter sp. 13R65 TaxID=3127458 RepID=UPI00301BC576